MNRDKWVRSGKRLGIKVATRKIPNEGWRVWKVSGPVPTEQPSKQPARVEPVIVPFSPTLPAATDPRVIGIHGLCIASGRGVKIDEARRMVAAGMTEDDVRRAIDSGAKIEVAA
jgi:hypothetical protein